MTRPDGFYADIATEREADREKMLEAFNTLRPLSDYTKKQVAAKMWQAAIAYMQEEVYPPPTVVTNKGE